MRPDSEAASRAGPIRLGSPERINPGDPEHRLENVVKIVSVRTPKPWRRWRILRAIVRAGVYRAPSIAVAEAAKVIETPSGISSLS